MKLSEYARRLNYPSRRLCLPPAILITDATRLPDPAKAARALEPGSAILFRDYQSSSRQFEARQIKLLCQQMRLLLIIGENPGLASEIGADGLHLTESSARTRGVSLAWKMRPGTLLTVAAHSPNALQIAAYIRADAALLSPLNPTASHSDSKGIGIQKFVCWNKHSPVPVYALGGVNASNAARLNHSGAIGIAGIDGWVDPEEHIT